MIAVLGDGVRRRALKAAVTLVLTGVASASSAQKAGHEERKGSGSEKETAAVEGLMREHGILRRALLIYGEAARRLRSNDRTLPASALAQTARLFRSFGEDYHERALEEQYIFPRAEKLRGDVAQLPGVLKSQHDHGREITEYILAVTRQGAIASVNAAPLADTLDRFVLMYRHHAAIEDTVLFPAWKQAIPEREYHELSERFEQLEHKMFGKDGFEDARGRIATIEQDMDIDDLARFSPPSPPNPRF